MTPFKAGERVAVYQGNVTADTFKSGRETGKILEFYPDGSIRVLLDGYSWNAYSYNPKQLRRLRTKKSKRRDFFVKLADGETRVAGFSYINPGPEYIHVREVSSAPKKPGVRVTYEQLAKAWDEHLEGKIIRYACDSSTFKKFCKALNLQSGRGK